MVSGLTEKYDVAVGAGHAGCEAAMAAAATESSVLWQPRGERESPSCHLQSALDKGMVHRAITPW